MFDGTCTAERPARPSCSCQFSFRLALLHSRRRSSAVSTNKLFSFAIRHTLRRDCLTNQTQEMQRVFISQTVVNRRPGVGQTISCVPRRGSVPRPASRLGTALQSRTWVRCAGKSGFAVSVSPIRPWVSRYDLTPGRESKRRIQCGSD